MKNFKKHFLFLFVLSITITSFAVFNKAQAVDACPGVPTVLYGGKTYNTVQIGTQCWLKEDLDIGTRINNSSSQTNNAIIEKYCYNDLNSNCNIYGGMYQWDEAMQYGTTEGTQGICPLGWHIPTKIETDTLATYLGGAGIAGGKLKEAGLTHWNTPNLGATNLSGFTGLGNGYSYRNGIPPIFMNLKIAGYFWTTTQTSGWPWFRALSSSTNTFNPYQTYKTTAYAVRCIKTGATTTVPDAPTNLTGVFGLFSSSVNLSWTAPANNGGSPITSYLVEYKQVSATTWSSTTSTTTTKTITGLVAGNSYDYRVSAVNAIGTGTSVSITAPAKITVFSGTPGNGQVTLNWTAPNNGGSPLTNYIIDYKLTSASIWSSITIPSNFTTKTIINLINGLSYDFRIKAWGSSAGVWSDTISRTPIIAPTMTTPSAPTNLTGVFITNHADLSWTAPSNNGGSPITSYLVEYKQVRWGPVWLSTTSTTTTKTISGLLGGNSYEYRVSAVNAIGTGPSISITAPSKVTGLTATPGNGQITLNWAVPYNGGSPLTEYRIRVRPASGTWGQVLRIPATNTTYTVTGLTNGGNFEVRVRAWGSSAGEWSEIISASPLASISPNSLVAGVSEAEILASQSSSYQMADVDMFSTSLGYGKKHTEVRMLQQFLNKYGYPVDAGGAGSLGKETHYFGEATRSALIRFQKEKGIYPAIGNFGPITRALVNKIVGNDI